MANQCSEISEGRISREGHRTNPDTTSARATLTNGRTGWMDGFNQQTLPVCGSSDFFPLPFPPPMLGGALPNASAPDALANQKAALN